MYDVVVECKIKIRGDHGAQAVKAEETEDRRYQFSDWQQERDNEEQTKEEGKQSSESAYFGDEEPIESERKVCDQAEQDCDGDSAKRWGFGERETSEIFGRYIR